MERLTDERENAKQKSLELRQELKRNESLLELMEKKFDDQHAKIMVNFYTYIILIMIDNFFNFS